MTSTVDLRCNLGPRRLFAKVRSGHAEVQVIDNLIEFSCPDCRRAQLAETGTKPAHVLHRFNLAGELVETEIVP
jgi:hypothetical protein